MSISRKISSVSGAALASLAGAGAVTVFTSPTMSLVAHADETHGQNVSTDPSVGDNSGDVKDPTQVSTIDDAYNDVQGDTARDTNQAQHSSVGWEFQDPNQAAESWKAPDDTTKEPGTDNTQTDWNIATGTNGKSASDTSYDVTGDSSENKFNPGNVNLYGVSAVSDKSASVRENWPAIEKANMAYDDFVNQYGTYWGPVYWGWYTHGVGYPTAYRYYGYPGYLYPGTVVGGGATVVNNNNNNNNNNNSSNNNALNSLNGLTTNLMAVNGGGNGGSGSGNGGSGGNGGSVNGQQAGQQQGQQGQNSSSSSSSSNSQTTVLPGGAVVGGVGYGVGGLGVVSNNNNNNNNNNNSNNLNNLSALSNLASVASSNGSGVNAGSNGNGTGNNGNGGNDSTYLDKDNNGSADNKADDNQNAKATAPAKDKAATPVVSTTTDGTEANSDTGSAVATGSGAGDGSGSGAGAGSGDASGADSGVGSAVIDSSASLPQTGNMSLEKSSVVGAGVIGATLLAMGASRKKKES